MGALKLANESIALDRGTQIEIVRLNRIRMLHLCWFSRRFCNCCRRSDHTWLASVIRCHISYCRHNYVRRVSTTDNPRPGAKDRRSKHRKSVAYGKNRTYLHLIIQHDRDQEVVLSACHSRIHGSGAISFSSKNFPFWQSIDAGRVCLRSPFSVWTKIMCGAAFIRLGRLAERKHSAQIYSQS